MFVRVTDCHIHINPIWEMRPAARALIETKESASAFERYLRHPSEFLDYLDRSGVDRAVLVNYVSPEVVGYTPAVNEFVSEFAQADPRRLIAVGSVLPTHPDPEKELVRLKEKLGIRAIKIHPPHQLFAPNAYVDGTVPGLREIYRTCERLRLPVIIHTGTSVFPLARNKFGQPLLCEDIAVDFPSLTLILAHGGRPFWTAEALFLARRFPNVYFDISSVPPQRLLEYFPRLETLAHKALFGSDWPGPGVNDIGKNLEAFRTLSLSESAKEMILAVNAEKVFPFASTS